ncbi:Aste57867_8070 [Aphanomyces stellatus]|uniref:Aste57867_8070 protein n=1 Tax=Aphanomyces stellatus TaxID=120398 RepID=A0A485KJ98_9STRA|nr:hypothetical protein As57867_008040 [Aphanomyces stellatus]VFT84960.1 Aste57867_8070 [Aphanomyces stellatus]
MASNRPVWYCLVDGKGEAYCETTTHFVNFPSTGFVVEFKDAVHAKNDRILKEYVPSQLVVFANKAEFDKGPKKRVFLRSSATLNKLGSDEDDAFLVVVPTHYLVAPDEDYPAKRKKMIPVPRAAWFTSELTVFCTVELSLSEWLAMTYNGTFENLSWNGKEMEDSKPPMETESSTRTFQRFEMNFPVLMNDNRRSSVFVRPCYNELFKILLDDIEKRIQSVGVTGNPGIGKSRFYSYCVFRLTQQPIEGRILVIDCADKTYIFEDGAFRFISTKEELLQHIFNDKVIRLIDGQSTNLFGWTGVSILFTSPGYSDYKTFMKSTSVQYVMPPWTQKELSIAAEVADITTEEVKDRFQWRITRQAPISTNEAYSKARGLEIFKVVSRREEVNEKISQAYHGFYVTFGSDKIAEQVYDNVMNESMENLTAFMVINMEDTNSSSFRGKLFEIFCHHHWSSSGQHKLIGKLLHSDSQASQEAEYSIAIPQLVEVRSFSKLSDIPVSEFAEAKALYFRPKQKNFACIDSIYWNGQMCYLLQMTISNDHGIAHESLVKIHDWATKRGINYEYVFVVPKGQVQDYKVQNFLTTTRHVHKTPSKIAQGLVQYAVGVEMVPTLKHSKHLDDLPAN